MKKKPQPGRNQCPRSPVGTQAALPLFRAQGGGHLLQVSSMGRIIAVPDLGIYHVSKWALEGFSESLHYEGAPLGIKVTLLEPC